MSDPTPLEPINPAEAAVTYTPTAPVVGMMYCKNCGKKIHKSALTCPHCSEATEEPKAQKSKLVTLLLSLGLVTLLIAGGLAATMFYPQYQASREQSRKYEIVTIAQEATAKVEKYFREKGGVPKTLEEAGSTSKPNTSTVKSMVVHPQKGTLTIVLNYGRAEDKSLVYTPTIDDKQIISWACTSKDVPDNMLPPGCKPEQNQ
jgi:Tfp pilus assembly protein PilE